MKLLSEQINKIIDLYKNGKTSRELASRFHVDKKTIITYLRNNGIAIRPAKTNKYSCDYSFFEKIDTEEKAYWLGFLYADGCVRKVVKHNRYALVIALQRNDINHIEKFKNSIKSTHPIYQYNRKLNGNIFNTAEIHIYSKELVNNLIVCGCVPRKSFTIRWPNKIPKHLIHHFVRGYFDGDGCIHKNKFTIASNKQFCVEFQKWLMNECNLNKTKLNTSNRIHNIVYGGILQLKRIYLCLYKNANVFLERKKIKFDQISSLA